MYTVGPAAPHFLGIELKAHLSSLIGTTFHKDCLEAEGKEISDMIMLITVK